MHENVFVLIVAEIGLVIIGALGLAYGQTQLAYLAAGTFAGLAAGHLNGRRGG